MSRRRHRPAFIVYREGDYDSDGKMLHWLRSFDAAEKWARDHRPEHGWDPHVSVYECVPGGTIEWRASYEAVRVPWTGPVWRHRYHTDDGNLVMTTAPTRYLPMPCRHGNSVIAATSRPVDEAVAELDQDHYAITVAAGACTGGDECDSWQEQVMSRDPAEIENFVWNLPSGRLGSTTLEVEQIRELTP